jgi:integrase/recombinase XerC
LETHSEGFSNFLQYEKRFSSHTVTAYQADLVQWTRFLSENLERLTSVSEVRHSHLRSYVVFLMKEEAITPRSVHRKLSCLKTYFKWLEKQGFISENPTTKLVAPKVGKRLPVVLTEPQTEKLFNTTNLETNTGYPAVRDRLILEILYETGMRRGELAALKRTDIDLKRLEIKVFGKGGKERLVPFGKSLLSTIEAYLLERRQTFPNLLESTLLLTDKGEPIYDKLIYLVVKKNLSLVTNQEKRSPHVLRHSFATHLSNHGADLTAIKDLMGHASLSATQIYVHNDIEKLKKSYQKAHPKSKTTEENKEKE